MTDPAPLPICAHCRERPGTLPWWRGGRRPAELICEVCAQAAREGLV